MSSIVLFNTNYSIEQLQQSCRDFQSRDKCSDYQREVAQYVLNTLAAIAETPQKTMTGPLIAMLTSIYLDIDTLKGAWQVESLPARITIFQHLTATENIAVNIGLLFAVEYRDTFAIKRGVRENDLDELKSKLLIPKVVYKNSRLDIYGHFGIDAYETTRKVSFLFLRYEPRRLEVSGGTTYLRLFLRTLFNEPFADFILATLPFK